jgi:hypothetical protein
MTLADRIYVLDNGHMVEELAAPMVRAQPEMLHRCRSNPSVRHGRVARRFGK